MARKKAAEAAAQKPNSQTQVALLRGVNVGGKNPLPMKELAAIFVAAGCTNVRTYIQSGNVVCGAGPTIAKKLPALITREIEAHAGHRLPIVMRSAAELREAVNSNPYLTEGAETSALHLGFLADVPHPSRVAALDPKRSPPDRFHVHGREIYFHLPTGIGKSKLTSAYFDSKLATTLTVRNWRTVLMLLEMSEG